MRRPQRSRQIHAPKQQTVADTRPLLKRELTNCTDARLADATADGWSGRYRGISVGEIDDALNAERESRTLSPEQRFAKMMAGARS